jgi:hypothetical protein
LLRSGRFEELKQQIKLNQLDILGVCKTRWGEKEISEVMTFE